MTDINDAAQACIDYIRLYGSANFVELSNVLRSNGINPDGDGNLVFPGLPNVILWAGINDDFVSVINAIRERQDIIEPRGADVLTYAYDGGFLRLPIAKKPPKGGYKKPHWAPIQFNWIGVRPTSEEILAEVAK